MGLFAIINFVVWHLKRAEELNMEPVIDWQYYPNKYFTEDDTAGRLNPWSILFNQPSGVELEELYHSKNVHMGSGTWVPDALKEVDDEEALLESHRIYTKYIKLSERLKAKVKLESERIGFGDKRVLGVKIRGTDFVTSAPSDHSKVANVDNTVEIIGLKEEEWGAFDCIYLATEDQAILSRMKEIYKDRLYYTDSLTFEQSMMKDGWLGDFYEKSGIDKMAEMENYLVTTYLLSLTDSLIAPVVGGTLGAMRIHGIYSNLCLFRKDGYV